MPGNSIIDKLWDEYGYRVEEFDGTVSDLLSRGLRLLTDKEIANVSGIFQIVPQILTSGIVRDRFNEALRAQTEGSFRIVLDADRHLALSTKNPGHFSSNTFDSNNKNMRPAEWIPNEAKPLEILPEQVVANAVSAVAFFVGQYYQAQIATSMSALKRDVQGVFNYLESERRGTFESYANWLNSQAKYLPFILESDSRRQNEAQNADQMVRYFDDTIQSCNNHIASALRETKRDYTYKDIEKLFDSIASNMNLYHQALILYVNGTILSICLNSITNPKEISMHCEDMASRLTEYKAFKTRCISELNDYLSSADALNSAGTGKSVSAGIGVALPLILANPKQALTAVSIGKSVSSITSLKQKQKQTQRRNALVEKMNKSLEPCHDLSLATKTIAEFQYQARAVLKPEFVKIGEKIYTNLPIH